MRTIRPCAVCGTTRKSAQSARCVRHTDRRARGSKCANAMREVWAKRKATGYVPNDRGVQAMQRYNQARKHGIPYQPDLPASVIESIIAREHAKKRPTWQRSAA